jgi:hypothetical protein
MAEWTTTVATVTWTSVDDPSVAWVTNIGPVTVEGGDAVGALTGLTIVSGDVTIATLETNFTGLLPADTLLLLGYPSMVSVSPDLVAGPYAGGTVTGGSGPGIYRFDGTNLTFESAVESGRWYVASPTVFDESGVVGAAGNLGAVLSIDFDGPGGDDPIEIFVSVGVSSAAVAYDNTTSGLTASTVQAALDELATSAGVVLSDDTPAALGTADPGVSGEASRSDHVHALGWVTVEVDADAAIPANAMLVLADTSSDVVTVTLADLAEVDHPVSVRHVAGFNACYVNDANDVGVVTVGPADVVGRVVTLFPTASGWNVWYLPQEATELFYEATTSADWSVEPSEIGSALDELASRGSGGAALSDATPDGLGTAAAGVSGEASRSDHIHPMPDYTDVGADPAGAAQAVADTLGSAALANTGDFEAAGAVSAHTGDTTAAHAASAISVGTLNGNLSAVSGTDVEQALQAVDNLSLGGTVDVVSNVATSTILGRTTAGSGDSEELSASSVRTLLKTPQSSDDTVLDIRVLTQAAYNALTPVSTTLYFISG